MARSGTKFAVALGDYGVMVLSMALVVFIRYGNELLEERLLQHLTAFFLIFALWIVVFYILELYDFSTPFRHSNFLYATIFNTLIATAIFYLFRDAVDIRPRRNLFLIVAGTYVLIYGWRFLTLRLLDRIGKYQRIVLIGAGDHALELLQKLQGQRRSGFQVVAILTEPHDTVPVWVTDAGITRLSSVEELQSYAESTPINSVVISEDWYTQFYRELYSLIPLRVRFFQLTTFWEYLDQTIPVYNARESWFLEHLNRGPGKGYQALKRVGDIAVMVVFSPVFIILAILTALMVRVTSPGPVIFSQIRVGRNGKEYRVYKFRSMRTDAEKDGAQWAQENDPRITPIGGFLRTTRLDEIPQVYNVLRGEMSFIGPRPERPEFVTQLAERIPHYHLRHLVKPGLTGWAQVKYRYGASEEDAATKLTYDLYYVKNISLIMDIKILLKTVMIILGRHGR